MKKRIIFIIVTVIIFAFIVYFLAINRGMLVENLRKRPSLVIWIAALFSMSRILEAVKFKIVALPFKLRLRLSELMAIAFCVPFYNVAMPYGGIITNMVYLKRVRGFSGIHFVLVSSAKLITALLVNCLAGAGVLWIVFFRNGEYFGRYFFAVYALIFFVIMALFFIPDFRVKGKGHLSEALNRALEAWHTLRRQRWIFYLILILQVVSLLIFALRYFLVFRLLSIDATYIGLLAVIPAANILNSFNILPGNLGIRELVLSFSVKILGFDFIKGALSSMIDRLILTSVVLIVGGYLHLKLGYQRRHG